jgi:hypothetical protein
MDPQHTVRIEIMNSDWLRQVEAGSHMVLAVRCDCSAGCDLSGTNVSIRLRERVVCNHELSGFDKVKRCMEVNNLLIGAPTEVGTVQATMQVPARTIGGISHSETVANFSLTTIAVKTMLSIWDVPRPIESNAQFRIQVGLKSVRNLSMTGAFIAVFDSVGSLRCRAPVEPVPMKGTGAMYLSTIELTAPGTPGSTVWTVRSELSAIAHPHQDSMAELDLLVVKPPRFRVRIRLTDKLSGTGVGGTLLRLGPYQESTDGRGEAELFVAGGTYALRCWNPGYEVLSSELRISSNTDREFTMKPVVEHDLDFL